MRDGERPTQPARTEGDDDFTLDRAPLDPQRATAHALPAALRSPRGRALTLAATALLVVVVVVGLFARATSDPRSAVATLLRLPTATPAATFVPGANAVYFSNGAPWGALSIDGKRLPSADLTGYGVAVTRGAHQLVYQARYFPSLRCVFSAPRAATDTCPLDTSDSANQFLIDKALARVINLGSTGATLQADQRAVLMGLADDLLDRQTITATIAPGDRYLDDQGRIVTATTPLRFQLRESLDTSGSMSFDSNCYQFCPNPSFSNGQAPPGDGWPTRITIVSSWAITDTNGRPLTSTSYQAGQRFPNAVPLDVGIQAVPAGWRITGLTDVNAQAVTSSASQVVDQAVNDVIGGGYGLSFILGTNPLDGCVMEVAFEGQTSRLLWRFGALLAVDATAHHVFPHLPIANATEQAAAARIEQEEQAGATG